MSLCAGLWNLQLQLVVWWVVSRCARPCVTKAYRTYTLQTHSLLPRHCIRHAKKVRPVCAVWLYTRPCIRHTARYTVYNSEAQRLSYSPTQRIRTITIALVPHLQSYSDARRSSLRVLLIISGETLGERPKKLRLADCANYATPTGEPEPQSIVA